ncbi:L-piperidine-6-carboxylate dehydrogenase [Denitratisoma oestradiolicum]|uniref:aldehyde dehydrogenase (NAD(+)) n=1 Tax=Denitratisoma oestradiolicum TaxID=311182 RepID=A0A6S6XXP8_9PROT|nr:aldehyde dehydrogenase family protein [Denitratisoma oestradiolicum]TWO80559.1 aldehyde dehydrogenase family protein [Denitratisoma oestradiolicum]CAB1367629.1 Aldehyde dehydrogenase [Denitratisoma oestradiolicum]
MEATAVVRLLADLGVPLPPAGKLIVRSPIDGGQLTSLVPHTPAEVDAAVAVAQSAFLAWRLVPAPRRGELVRRLGATLRRHKAVLAELVILESGKIRSEALGEVQEMIDICDFATGLSRQLYGLTIASERPGHRLMETWHPLGVCGVITAFNFPVAVWAWNAALALVCGNGVVWKPSEKTPLTALACQALLAEVAAELGDVPPGLSTLLLGGADVGAVLADHPAVALVSATGSCAMGRAVAPQVAARFGRSLLELGGNNAMIVAPSVDLDLAQRAIVFAAAGTAGQRCTSLRRLFVHEAIAPDLLPRLRQAYASLRVGDPRDEGILVGPLIDAAAFAAQQGALAEAKADGGHIFGGERVTVAGGTGGYYVRPALVDMPAQTDLVTRETFAPILYIMTYRDFAAAIALHNAVPQGLASAIFTNDLREMEVFLSAAGSDCGIANVNVGPSGAEIGGAFGGEKETGGGREAGSDAWKAYMRRATNTINYSRDLPLAQGVKFV